jgi:drug/metabolite transporter (DMT)-like permease
LGALALWVVVYFKKVVIPKDKILWLQLWIVSLLLNVFPGILFALAQTEVTSVLAGIVNATTPLTTLLAIFIFFRKEKVKSYQVLGLLVGFSGVATVFGVWRGLGSNAPWAIGALLVAVSCYGLSFPFSTRFIMPRKLQPEALATIQVSMAAITLLPLYLIDGVAEDKFLLLPVLSVLALGIFGSGIAYIWNFRIIELAGSSIASSVTYLTPIVAVAIGIAFLGEPFSWNEPIGGLIVLAGSAIAQGRHLRKK